ncbi:MAG TPA: MlaD family protein [Kofleriaceae bacterium]|jgi:phospholipid/cholesterol/gamma-HCH transport system substrate-binding protein
MTSKAKKIRAGIFVLAAMALLAFVLVVFAGMAFWKRKHHYQIEVDNSVMGLQNGAYVYFDGVRVGRVQHVGFSKESLSTVVVTIEVDAATPVHTDTVAMLQYTGITGLKVIDLRGGSVATPILPDGSAILRGKSTLDTLEERGKEIADRAAAIVDKTDKLVTNLTLITDPAQFEGLEEVIENTKTLTANLARSTATFDSILADNRARISGLVANAATVLDRVERMVTANEAPMRSAMSDLQQASRNFKELSREVRQKPSRLIYSPPAADRKLP